MSAILSDHDAENFVVIMRTILPNSAVAVDPEVVASYARDEATLVPSGEPLAVLFPETTEQVSAIVKAAAHAGIKLIPRGAGTGLAGGANATDGCAVVVLSRMTHFEIDPVERIAIVQPGVITGELDHGAREYGLWYPPDPGSRDISTIGGNVSTNAGGLCCVKYGVTGDYVRELEVVLASGDVVRVGRRTRKGVAGYDLVHLFVGSEGTLGIITEVVVGLLGAPQEQATLVATFSSLETAGKAISEVMQVAGPSLMEILDNRTVRAINDWKGLGLDRDAAATILVRVDGQDPVASAELQTVSEVCSTAGGEIVAASVDKVEAEMLFEARRLAYPALERMGDVLIEDVAVPIGSLAPMLHRIGEIGLGWGVDIATFGHAGDGNLHPTFIFDAADADSRVAVSGAFDDICNAAVELGGTVTGEHGVGLLKRRQAETELGHSVVKLNSAIRLALDPCQLLNPGKAVG